MLDNRVNTSSAHEPTVGSAEELAQSTAFTTALPRLSVASQWLKDSQSIVLDLDHFLISPNGTHSALFIETARSLGFSSSEVIQRSFIENRGNDYFDLLKAIYSGCGGEKGLGCSEGAFYMQLNKVSKDTKNGIGQLQLHPVKLPGAEELLQKLEDDKKDSLICTGSFRAIAELELTLTGLNRFINFDRLICADDVGIDKYDPKYWSYALQELPRAGTLGFDDRLDAAESMLKGGIERVIVVPKEKIEPEGYAALKAIYPERLIWLESLVGI